MVPFACLLADGTFFLLIIVSIIVGNYLAISNAILNFWPLN